jgi:hypothetical protein
MATDSDKQISKTQNTCFSSFIFVFEIPEKPPNTTSGAFVAEGRIYW